MKNHIFVLPRYDFKELVPTLSDEKKKGIAFISIHEPIGKTGKELFGGASETILDEADNVLNLWFDDAEEELPLLNGDKLVLFNDEMANQVIDFVEKNKNAKGWVLHCTMGKCRSGAVGSFLVDYFGIDWFEFKKTNPKVSPNCLVKTLLTSNYLKKLQM
tara:strand:+ start:5905 stop:6384 length:480 start_codon:yes stop_codon:yes gene_type:complete